MGRRHDSVGTRESAAEVEMRNQEVLRANRELAAYFKGHRTEREARAALKIIKAFVRDREGRAAKSRSPLPGTDVAKTPTVVASRRAANTGADRHRQKTKRKARGTSLNGVTAPIEPPMDAERAPLPAAGEDHSDRSGTL
jgi:hypothetical protein